MRFLPGTRVAALLAIAALLCAALPVNAAWTSSTVDDSWLLTNPSLAVDGADHTGISYRRVGADPGILYTTNATGGWVSTRVTSSDDWWPSLRFDMSDHAHVAFARRTGTTGVYVTDNSTGGWAEPTLVASDLDPSSPSLAIDGSGKLGVVFTSNVSFNPGLFFTTNATGDWVTTQITSATWDGATSLAFDAAGHAQVLFARYAPEAPGIYYATNATGSWVVTRLTTTYDDAPQLALDGAGRIHAAFTRLGTGTSSSPNAKAFYATNETGSWAFTQLPVIGWGHFGAPAIALDPQGVPHVAISFYAHSYQNEAPLDGRNGQIYDWSLANGQWNDGAYPTDDGLHNDDAPSIGFLSDGTTQLAFRRLYTAAGLRFISTGNTSTAIDGSHLDGAPGIDLGPDETRDIAFGRRTGTEGATIVATGTGAGWALGQPGANYPAAFDADVAADGTGGLRVVDGSGYYSNTSSSWTADITLPGNVVDSEVEVDGSGHAYVVAAEAGWSDWSIDFRSNETGGWVTDPPASYPSCCPLNPMPSLALDGGGKPHVAYIDQFGLAYQNRKSGTWTAPAYVGGGTGRSSWPSLAIDGSGKVHIAFLRWNLGGTVLGNGVYYVTNKSGTWVITRLTRSLADGAPSIALDATGHVYIATTRAAWAADPGVYVMTNATGSWVTARVVASNDAGTVSLSVTSGGLARMAFATGSGVLEYENGSTTVTMQAGGALSSVLAAQHTVDTGGISPLNHPSATGKGSPASAGDAAKGGSTSAPVSRHGNLAP